MNGRERIIAAIKGEIPDRVPVSPFIQEEFLEYYYPEKSKVNRVTDAVECAKELGIDVIPRGREFQEPHFLKKSFPNWEVSKKEAVENNFLVKTIEIKTPEGTLRQVQAGPYNPVSGHGIHMVHKEYFIDTENDLNIFLKYVPALDKETMEEMKEYGRFVKKIIGDIGIAAPWGWCGVFNVASEFRNIEKLLIDPYIEPDFYSTYMNKLTEMMVEYNAAYADTELECIGIEGNIANSSVVGPNYFDEFILPYEAKVVSAIKANGTFALYHNCGKAKVLQKSYVKMGLDVWETVAEEPVGDSTLRQAKEDIGSEITLSGNLDQVKFLKEASLAEIDRKVMEIMNIGKPGGRFIFACSDFLEKDTPIENVKKVIEVAKREGKY